MSSLKPSRSGSDMFMARLGCFRCVATAMIVPMSADEAYLDSDEV